MAYARARDSVSRASCGPPKAITAAVVAIRVRSKNNAVLQRIWALQHRARLHLLRARHRLAHVLRPPAHLRHGRGATRTRYAAAGVRGGAASPTTSPLPHPAHARTVDRSTGCGGTHAHAYAIEGARAHALAVGASTADEVGRPDCASLGATCACVRVCAPVGAAAAVSPPRGR